VVKESPSRVSQKKSGRRSKRKGNRYFQNDAMLPTSNRWRRERTGHSLESGIGDKKVIKKEGSEGLRRRAGSHERAVSRDFCCFLTSRGLGGGLGGGGGGVGGGGGCWLRGGVGVRLAGRVSSRLGEGGGQRSREIHNKFK